MKPWLYPILKIKIGMKDQKRWFKEETALQTLNAMRSMAQSLESMNRTLQLIERRGLPARAVEAERDPPILRNLFQKAWLKV